MKSQSGKKFMAEGGVEVTEELLDQWAAPWEAGDIPGKAAGFVRSPGRPRISDEPSRVISIRLPESVIKACERRAEAQGETRSQWIRDTVIAGALEAM